MVVIIEQKRGKLVCVISAKQMLAEWVIQVNNEDNGEQRSTKRSIF